MYFCDIFQNDIDKLNKQMKILLCSSSFGGGGITSYALELIDKYSVGNDFYVMLGNDKKSPIRNKNVKVIYQNMSDISICNLKKTIEIINNDIKPDIVINSFAKVISLIAPYLNDNIKLITVSHSLKYIEAELAGMNSKYVDKIIALSHSGKRYISKRFSIKDTDKISVIYNFVGEHPQACEYRKRKLENKTINIVYPGGCAGSKTPELVIRVLRELQKTNLNFKFYWMGGNYAHLSRHFPFLGVNDIRDFVKKDERIVFTGKIPREEANEIISNANIFFSPSRREGCPMSLIEAMRVGAICIVSDFPIANKEIIKDGVNGYEIPHKNIQGFVECIKDIIENHSKYSHIYDNSYKTYYEELRYESWKRQMDEIINNPNTSHTARRKRISEAKLRFDVLKFKIRTYICKLDVTINEDIRVILSLLKLK